MKADMMWAQELLQPLADNELSAVARYTFDAYYEGAGRRLPSCSAAGCVTACCSSTALHAFYGSRSSEPGQYTRAAHRLDALLLLTSFGCLSALPLASVCTGTSSHASHSPARR